MLRKSTVSAYLKVKFMTVFNLYIFYAVLYIKNNTNEYFKRNTALGYHMWLYQDQALQYFRLESTKIIGL